MHRCCMSQDCLDIPEVHYKRDWACAFSGSVPAEFDQALAIKFTELQMSERVVEGNQAKVLGSADPNPYLRHVLPVEANEIAEEFCVTRLARGPGS